MEENQVYSDNIGKLYRDAVSRGMKADEQTFRNYLSESDENRRKVYNDLVARGMKADENQFFEYIGYPMQQPAQRVDVSDVEQGNVTDGTDRTDRTQTSAIPPLDGGIPTVTEAQVAEMDGQQHYQPRVGGEPMKTPEKLEAEARETAGVKTPTDEESVEPFGTERQRFAPSWGFERSQRMQDQPPAQPAPKPAMQTVNGKTEYDFSPENLQGMKEFSEGAYIKAFDEVNALMPDIERSIRERALFDTEQNNRNKSASQDAIQYHADKLAEHRIKQFRDKIEKEGVAGFDAGQMTKYLAFDDEDLMGKIDSAFKDKDEADRYMQAYHQSPEWKQEQLKGLEQTDAMLQGVKQQRKQNFLKTVGGMFGDLAISGAMAEGGMSQQDQQQLVKMQDDIRKQNSVNMAVNQQLHQAENTLGIARKNIEDGEGNMFVKLGRGVRYADLDNLIPVSELYGQMGILQLYDKLDENGNPKEQLTDDEQTLYNALAMNQYVQQLYGDNVNMLNRIGRGLPEQAMFTLSFLLGSEFAGAQTIGRGATKALQRGIGNVVKKEIKSGLGRFMLDKALPTAFGMGAETLYRTGLQTGNIVSGAIERHVGTLRIDQETGEVGGFEGGVDWGEAVWKSTLAVANENFTELLGDQVFEPGWGWLGRNTKAGQRIADFRKTIGEIGDGRVDDILKMGSDISQKAGWNGWAFETLEELAGNFNDAAFIHDQTWEEAFSKETIMETTLNCMIFGMVMGSSTTSTQALRNLPSTAATRKEKRKAAAIIDGMDGISTDEIDNHIDNDSSNGLADWLVERHKAGNSNGDWTDAQRAAVANYVRASVAQKAQRHFKGMQLQEDVRKMEADVDEMTNNRSGNVIDANFEIDGQKYTGKIIGGRVSSTENDVVDADGQPKKTYTYNPYLSSATLSVIIDGTGEKKMIPSRAVTSINDITGAEQFKSERAAELAAAMQQSIAAMDEVTTASDIWGGNLQAGVLLPYNGGVVRFDGKNADGQWLITPVASKQDGTLEDTGKQVALDDFEFRKAGMIERMRAMQKQGASEEEIEDAVDDINTEQTIQNIEQSGNEDNIWDAVAGFMQGYVKTNEEGDFIPEESRPEAAAGYLVALQKGDIPKTIDIINARVSELEMRLVAKPQEPQNNGEGIVGIAANQSLADSAAEDIRKQIGFLTTVRNGLVAKQAEQAQMEAQKPVSQMEVGQEFPVVYDGQQAVAVVVGKDADGRNVVTIRDQEGNDLESGIDDMTNEQWEAVRVRPQEVALPTQQTEQQESAEIEQKPTEIEQNAPENEQKEPENEQQEEVAVSPAPEQTAMPMRKVKRQVKVDGQKKTVEAEEEDYLAVPAEQTHQYLYEQLASQGLTEQDANDIVNNNLNEANKTLDEAKKKTPSDTGSAAARIAEKQQIEDAIKAAQGVVDYWNAVKAMHDKVVAERIAAQQAADEERHTQAVAEEEASRADEERKAREREATGANNVGPNIREKWEGASKVEGNADEITLANGERIAGHYVLVESGAASASHDALNGFAKTEGFPLDENEQSVNDRDYERDQNAQQITRQIAAEYDSRALQQPVVVSQDGVVLSGNGRTMAGEIAAAQDTDGAYIEYLKKYAPKYGFTPEQVDGMAHPRVVFVPDASMPYTAETFAKFNQQEMKGQSKTEQAVKLGKLVDDATFGRIIMSINRFDTLGDFYADTNATAEAIGELLKAGAINQMQHTEMFDGDAISAQGREILENMLIGKAFESNPDAVRQLTAFKSLRQSVITALAEISNNIALGEYSLESELSDAIALAYNARKNGYKAGDSVSEFARQGKLFETEEDATAADYTNATVLMLADVMNDNRVTRLKKVLSIYNQQAEQSAAGQTDLFAEGVKTKQEILDEVLVLLQHGTESEQQQALDASVEQRKAAAEQGTGVQENGDTGEGDAGERGVTTTPEAEKDAFKDWFGDWENDPQNASKVVDADGKPMLVYHSYDRENYDSGLVFMSKDKNFSKEFGENTDAVYVNLRNPYIAKDGILRDADGNEIMFEGEPASIGYLDSVPSEYLDWLQSNYDGVMDEEGTFIVAFSPDQIKKAPVEPPMESAGEGTEQTGAEQAPEQPAEETAEQPETEQKKASFSFNPNTALGKTAIVYIQKWLDAFKSANEKKRGFKWLRDALNKAYKTNGRQDFFVVFNDNGEMLGVGANAAEAYGIALNHDEESFNVVRQTSTDNGTVIGFTNGWLFTNDIPESEWRDDSGKLRQEVKDASIARLAKELEIEGEEAAMESQQTEEEKQSSPWYGTIDDAPTPEGLKRGQKARLFEDGERAYRNASLKVPTFQLGVEKKVELTYDMFEKEYADIVGDFFMKEDRPYLKEFYDYFNTRMDAAAEIKSQPEGTEQEAANTQPTEQANNTTGGTERTEEPEQAPEQPAEETDEQQEEESNQELIKGAKWDKTGEPEPFRRSKKGDSHDASYTLGKKTYGITRADADTEEVLLEDYGTYVNIWNAYEKGEVFLSPELAAAIKAKIEYLENNKEEKPKKKSEKANKTDEAALATQQTEQANNTTDNQTEETAVEENSGNQEKTSQDETPAEQPIDDSDIDALIEDYKKKAAATNKIWSAWLADPSGKPADYGTTRDEEAKAYGRVREALAGVSEEKLAEMENTNYGDSLLNDLIKEERSRRNEQKEIEQRFTDGLEKQGEIGKPTKPVSIEKILPEFTSRDEQRPIMNCIYYDPEGYAVASDAFILIASKSQYDPKQEGKMVAAHKIKGVAEKGDEVEGKFMKWRNVISQAKANSAEIDLPKLRDFLAGVKELMKGSKDDAIVQVRMPNGEIIGFEPEYLLKFVQGAEAMGVKEIEYIAPNRAITGRSEDGIVLLMPKKISADYDGRKFYYDLSDWTDKAEKETENTEKESGEAVSAVLDATGKIEDFGEKIGMARKDTATKGFKRGESEMPAWKKKYRRENVTPEELQALQNGEITLSSLLSGASHIARTQFDPTQPFVGFYIEEPKTKWGHPRYYIIRDGQRKIVAFNSEAEYEAALPVFEVRTQGYRVTEKDGMFVIVRTASNGKLVEYAEFDTKEDAEAYMTTPEGAISLLNKKRENYELPALENLTRNGMKDWRKGRNITGEDMLETFGFRGGEFGNWVNADERQQFLNTAYDALMDLASELGVSPRALSLGGALSIAFGARGKQHAKAHYETSRAVINLTKMNGAGSLAHEWAHALDNYFGMLKANIEREHGAANDKWITSNEWSRNPNIRKEVDAIFTEIVNAMKKKRVTRQIDIEKAQKEVDVLKALVDKAVKQYREQFAKGITKYAYNRKTKQREQQTIVPTEEQLAEFDRLMADFEKNPEWVWDAKKQGWRFGGETGEKIYELLKDVMPNTKGSYGPAHNAGYYMDKLGKANAYLEQAKSGESETVTVKTDFLEGSEKADKGRAGTYYTKDLEMFARAFETYLAHKMADAGHSSDYLTYKKGEVFKSFYGFTPYPEGEELKKLSGLFDKLFETLEEREGENGAVELFSIDYTDEGTFFSNAARAVEGIKQEKATPEQWLAMLKKNGGLKEAEDKWLGLSQWLQDSKAKTLTKQEVLDFINENMVQVEEVEYGGSLFNINSKQNLESDIARAKEDGESVESVLQLWDKMYGMGLVEAYQKGEFTIDENGKVNIDQKMLQPINSTRLNYTTQGLQNKREIALTVPTIEPWNENDEIHFGDAGEGRAVAWVRFGETTDADGNRVLVIDEIQSKRHQEGREKGYKTKGEKPKYNAEINAAGDGWIITDENGNFIDIVDITQDNRGQSAEDIVKNYVYREEGRFINPVGTVPAAPFERNWHELAMKRMLRYAAENGFDKVAWTKGEQQAERYNMESAISSLYASRDGNKYYVEVYDKNGDEIRFNGVIGDSRSTGSYTQQELKEYFGAEAAKEIISSVDSLPSDEEVKRLKEKADSTKKEEDIAAWRNSRSAKIDGKNLFRGEGMKGFYDQMLPRFMDKYGKQWGVKVGEVTLPNVEEAGRTMWAVDVTDAMKESVMQGQPMFSVKEGANETNTEAKDIAYNAVRQALANAGIEVEVATDEEVERLKAEMKTLQDSKGVVRGWVGNDGKIHLTKDGLNAETPIHEYTHLWAEALQMTNPDLWEQIKGLLKDTPEWQRITSMKEYSNLKDDDRIAGEVLAHISGKKNAERMEAEAKRMIDEAPTLEEAAKAANLLGRMRDALKKFWTWVGKTLLGKKGNINIDQVSNMVLADLTNGIDPFHPRGGKRTNRTKRTDASVEGEMERIKSEAQANGTFMKAPNGKPTKLTERQWLQVRTQAFKKWFGDWENDPENASKVVDENGEPMVVYHGGKGEITVFDKNRIGENLDYGTMGFGFYFTSDRENAENYARNAKGEGEPTVVEAFLNIRNAKDVNWNELDGESRKKSEAFTDKAIAKGHDGFTAIAPNKAQWIVAFSPSQIKSADPVTYDDKGNVIPLSQRFNKRNADIRFSIDDETDETDRADVPEMSDEDAEKYDAGRMTFTEIATEGVIKAAEKNKEDLRMRNEAVKAIGVSINRLRQAMAKQKEYDKATVDSIVRLARMMIDNGYMDNMSRSEVKRLMTLAKNATGKTDITKQANAVVDLMLKHQLKAAEAVQQKLLATKGSKVNASGVEVQAGLDITGQRTLKAMKEGIELDEAALAERIADVNDRMGGTDKTLAANAAEEYEGLMMAKDYHDMISQSEQDEAQLRHELDQAKEDVKNGTLGRKEYKELAERIDAALRKNMAERVTAFTRLNQQLAEVINGSKGRAKEFREKQMERVREIQHNANSDMKGTPASEHKKAVRINKAVNNDIVRYFMLPVATFDEMLRFFGRKSVDGMGYLWQRFMDGYTDANDTEWRSLKKDHDALDEKVSEVMGGKMRWSDLFSMERKMDPIEVEFYDLTTDEEGNSVRVKEKHPLTQGNALYIYMVNKMDDGAMKLRRMGITDEDVDRIAGQLDPRFLQLADWIQDEFLPKKREAFNAVHMRMFGAPMAAIEEYFPLVTNSRSRGKDEDISEHDKGETKPSTITGSIIKRTVNTTPLDLTNADAFDVLLGHLRDMEHWAAYAEFNRDLNTLLSYKRFKNQVLNTSSVRFGAGETLWNNFKDVCAIAAGVYRPTKARADKLMVNISKGVTAAKISFRLYTALKQLLSYPAYFSEANPIELAKSTGRPAASFNWALDNLPGFAERWQSRQAGDSRLKETDVDWGFWKNKFVETAARWGMTPNAFVDGLTVAMGAKAIYESKMKAYMKAGYSEAEAKEKALKEASVAVNETQQSSQNAYLSAMQLDRTLASVGLTVFRNASMGYIRRLLRAVDNLKRKFTKGYKEESVEFMRKKMVREGLTEEQAKAASERAWRISWVKDAANVVIFGYVMQFMWNLGYNLIYLIFGDDDDEKEKMLEDAALHAFAGPVEGLSGGSVISELANMEIRRIREKEKYGKPITSFRNYDFNLLPIMSDMQTIINRFEQDGVRGIQDIVNLVIQAGVGVNPQTITDAAVAIVDAADGDLGLGKEIGLCALRIMQVPQSQLDQLYIDELGMSAKDAKALPMEELAQRYAAYKRMKDAPLTGWAYSDEAKEKVDKRYVNRFVKLVQERVANMDDEALERNMDDNDDLMLKKQVGKEVASRLEGKDTYGNQPQSNWKEETKKAHLAYQQLRGYVDLCEDVVLQKAQADADKAYEAALEEGKWTEAQTQQMRAKGIEQAREQLNKMRRQLGQGNGQYDQQIMENIRAMRSRYMEYYGLKGKKE